MSAQPKPMIVNLTIENVDLRLLHAQMLELCDTITDSESILWGLVDMVADAVAEQFA